MQKTFAHKDWGWLEKGFHEFNPVLAHFALNMARDSYRNDERYGETLQSRGFHCIQMFQDQNLQAIVGRKLVSVPAKPDSLVYVVTFRGTDDLADIIGDLDIRLTDFPISGHVGRSDLDLKAHHGIYSMIKRFENRLADIILDQTGPAETLAAAVRGSGDDPGRRFLLCGHSLGGSLATLFGLRLVEEHGFPASSVAIYTFGAPPVVSKDIADIYNRANSRSIRYNQDAQPRSLNLYRFVSTDDPMAEFPLSSHRTGGAPKAGLPSLPFTAIGLHHLGDEFKFNPRLIPDFHAAFEKRFGRPYSPKKVVDAHMMAGYRIGTEKILELMVTDRSRSLFASNLPRSGTKPPG